MILLIFKFILTLLAILFFGYCWFVWFCINVWIAIGVPLFFILMIIYGAN